jgi:hypothetical protein
VEPKPEPELVICDQMPTCSNARCPHRKGHEKGTAVWSGSEIKSPCNCVCPGKCIPVSEYEKNKAAEKTAEASEKFWIVYAGEISSPCYSQSALTQETERLVKKLGKVYIMEAIKRVEATKPEIKTVELK